MRIVILINIYQFDFGVITKELKKQNISLSLKQKDEWEDYYNDCKAELTKIKEEVIKLEKEIDEIVYQLYELTSDEIKIVEGQT